MKITCLAPGGDLTPELVRDVLLLVAVIVPAAEIAQWTRLELLLAYDWAMREHLRGSDNPGLRRRPRPRFLAVTA